MSKREHSSESWEYVSLGDVCVFKGGSGFKESFQGKDDGDHPFIKVSDLNLRGNEKYVINSNNWVSDFELKELKAALQPIGATVFAKVGAALKLNRRRLLVRPTAIDNNMMAAIPDEKHLNREYLYFFLLGEDLGRFSQESAVPSINQGHLESIKIPLPPLAEQRKIAEILRTWDEAIETAEAELKTKQERKRGLMVKCLAPAIEAKGANGWRTVRLGEICNPQQWRTIGQSQMTATGTPVYGANSFIGFFSESNHDDDVIAVSCRGSCGEVAFVAGPSYVTGNSMCLDDLSREKVNIYWLYQCLKLRGFRDIISGSAQPQIIRKDVIKVKISLPPLSAQEKTAEVLLSADHDIETIDNRIESLRTQKRGLMQKLLTGEVRVAA
jgi:type I restriction enzyme S subunit